MLPAFFLLYVVLIRVYLILTPKAASPPALVKGTNDEIDEKVSSSPSQATCNSESVQEQLLEHSGTLYEESVFSRRSYSQATRYYR